jgi:hypothetical protein
LVLLLEVTELLTELGRHGALQIHLSHLSAETDVRSMPIGFARKKYKYLLKPTSQSAEDCRAWASRSR